MSINDKLDSWKAIATHLNRTVRTVQRWERDLGLPVHRFAGRKRDMVYAFARELDAWLASGGGAKALAEPADADSGETPQAIETAGVTAGSTESAATGSSPENSRGAAPIAQDQSRGWRWGVAGAVGLAVLYAVVAIGGFAPPPAWSGARNPVDWDVDERHVIALDEKGREIWRYRFDRVLDPAHHRRIRANLTTPTAGVQDLDGDGKNELLFVPGGPDGELFCFNYDGSVRFARRSQYNVRYGRQTYTGFAPRKFRVTKPTDGRAHIWVSVSHHLEFPAVIEKLDAHGNLLAGFWHGGHESALIEGEVNGRRVMMVGFMENDGQRASLAVLDYENPSGTAPAENDHYRCKDCPAGDPLAFFIFPHSEFSRATKSALKAHDILAERTGGMTAGVLYADPVLYPDPPTGFYKFDAQFHLVEAFTGSDTATKHELLRSRGLIDHAYDPSEEHQLFPVLRWNGTEFTKLFGPGHEASRAIAKTSDRKPGAKPAGRASPASTPQD